MHTENVALSVLHTLEMASIVICELRKHEKDR